MSLWRFWWPLAARLQPTFQPCLHIRPSTHHGPSLRTGPAGDPQSTNTRGIAAERSPSQPHCAQRTAPAAARR
ncbi:hypothetical protein KCU85_g379, partial [Aureobasidium melanogenum]